MNQRAFNFLLEDVQVSFGLLRDGETTLEIVIMVPVIMALVYPINNSKAGTRFWKVNAELSTSSSYNYAAPRSVFFLCCDSQTICCHYMVEGYIWIFYYQEECMLKFSTVWKYLNFIFLLLGDKIRLKHLNLRNVAFVMPYSHNFFHLLCIFFLCSCFLIYTVTISLKNGNIGMSL